MEVTDRDVEHSNSNSKTVPTSSSRREKVARVLIRLLAIYSSIVLVAVVSITLVFSHDSKDRAIILMASGLVLIWILLGGTLTLRYQNGARQVIQKSSLRWEWKFLFFAITMALIEEAITTSMTNLAPEFGSQIGVAYITASNNYLIVISFSSVVVFVPEFVGWTLLLRRYDFSPNEVFLMYGLLGTTMEATLNPTALVSGFWFFVYGLMVYLPAYCIPQERGALKPRWRHYVFAYFLPLLIAIPIVVVDTLIAHHLGIVLW